MTDHDQIFLSYSHNDLDAAAHLRRQLQQNGLAVFKDDASIREGDLWLNRLQTAVDACTGFILLVGRDGVSRWIGAEAQAALNRHFGPHDDAERLPIFPILLGDTLPDGLPAFLRLFQATPWNGSDPLSERLLEQIRERTIVASQAAMFQGCPFVGLDAFGMDQARLFFGRQKETLDALACFDTRPGSPTVRWLEINGNSGAGKSSLMNAGLLPLVKQGWLWPRTGFERWTLIGPMMPGERPVGMLAERLAQAFGDHMTPVRERLASAESALAEELRTRKQPGTAFLLAIDQFEELFTFTDPDERKRFDDLLAAALEDADCPLFLISTVRTDFLERFEADLPRLTEVSNRRGKAWRLPPIGDAGLREIIDGPARLAGLDVSEVQEAIVAEARGEPGALPLVENALDFLWNNRAGNRLSGRLFNDQGGLAGILSDSADDLLGADNKTKDRALKLLYELVEVDPEGRRHTRRRISHADAVAVAGGGAGGQALVNRLSGERFREVGHIHGPLRLITVTEEGANEDRNSDNSRWVDLIHETLIRSKGLNEKGEPQGYWPTLWNYIEANKSRAARRKRLELQAREWAASNGIGRLFGLAGWSAFFGFRGLAKAGGVERRYLRWSKARFLTLAVLLLALIGFVAENFYWAAAYDLALKVKSWTPRWAYWSGLERPLPTTVAIPKGNFMMGSATGDSDEKPPQKVTFDAPFHLGRTEVNFAEYEYYCAHVDACVTDRLEDSGLGRDDRPIINVNHSEAKAYARWLGAITGSACRLPSEAEWEYAARAGTTTEYALPADPDNPPGGSDDIEDKGLANCRSCGSQWDGKTTAPVRRFDPNAWGVHDMHGNVWEWVEDCWHGNYKDAPKKGQAWLEDNEGDCALRVRRGGSWNDDPGNARSANRFRDLAVNRSSLIGFRVLCSSPIVEH